jgi:hypothetical protein
MAEEDVEVVRGVIDAWNQHDVPRVVGHLAADVEADWSESIGPFRGLFRGPGEVEGLIWTFLDAWEGLRWEVEELRDLGGGRVLQDSRMVARGKGSEVEVSASAGILWTVRAGTIAHVKLYQSAEEAVRAVGELD